MDDTGDSDGDDGDDDDDDDDGGGGGDDGDDNDDDGGGDVVVDCNNAVRIHCQAELPRLHWVQMHGQEPSHSRGQIYASLGTFN